MAEKGRMICSYDGEQWVASEPAKCVNCGAAIVYDPLSLAEARRQHPTTDIELWCLGCAGKGVTEMTDQHIRDIRAHMRKNPHVGPLVDLVSDEAIRTLLVKRRSQ